MKICPKIALKTLNDIDNAIKYFNDHNSKVQPASDSGCKKSNVRGLSTTHFISYKRVREKDT